MVARKHHSRQLIIDFSPSWPLEKFPRDPRPCWYLVLDPAYLNPELASPLRAELSDFVLDQWQWTLFRLNLIRNFFLFLMINQIAVNCNRSVIINYPIKLEYLTFFAQTNRSEPRLRKLKTKRRQKMTAAEDTEKVKAALPQKKKKNQIQILFSWKWQLI